MPASSRATPRPYVHPETGAPWFRCPACASDHVRPMRAYTNVLAMSGTIVAASEDHDCALPGTGRAVCAEWSEITNDDHACAWLACGACRNPFRADRATIVPFDVKPDWDVVHQPVALNDLRVRLVAAQRPDCGLPDWLRRLPIGADVQCEVVQLRCLTGPWLDERLGNASLGASVHPDAAGTGRPAWMVETAPTTIGDGAGDIGYDEAVIAYDFVDERPMFGG